MPSLSHLSRVLTCHVRTGGQGWFGHAGKVSCRRGKGAGGARPVWRLWEAVDRWTTGRRHLACLVHLSYRSVRGKCENSELPNQEPTWVTPTPNQAVGFRESGEGKGDFQKKISQDEIEERILE